MDWLLRIFYRITDPFAQTPADYLLQKLGMKSREPFHGPFSGLPFEDLFKLWEFLESVERENKMVVEALDCVIGELKDGKSVDEAIWFAVCEWDL